MYLPLIAKLEEANWVGKLMGFPPNFRELISASDGVTYWAKDDKARRELGYSPRDLATDIGQHHVAGTPLDQRHAKVALEVANLHRQRRLGDGTGVRSAPEMAVFGQR